MSSPSNLYAEKIFSEHPKSLWALDDKCDYISLINESFRDMDSWEITGGISSEYSISDEPFPESVTTRITGDVIPDNILGTIVCVSPDMSLNLNQLNSDLGTFTVGTYIKSLSPYFAGIEIGYEYDDTTSGELVRNLKPFSVSVSDTWILGSETFMIPNENTSFRLVIKIKYYGGAQDITSNIFLLNGLSVGQWSEEFNSNSLGISPIIALISAGVFILCLYLSVSLKSINYTGLSFELEESINSYNFFVALLIVTSSQSGAEAQSLICSTICLTPTSNFTFGRLKYQSTKNETSLDLPRIDSTRKIVNNNNIR
jgi:hypothetical protein